MKTSNISTYPTERRREEDREENYATVFVLCRT